MLPVFLLVFCVRSLGKYSWKVTIGMPNDSSLFLFFWEFKDLVYFFGGWGIFLLLWFDFGFNDNLCQWHIISSLSESVKLFSPENCVCGYLLSDYIYTSVLVLLGCLFCRFYFDWSTSKTDMLAMFPLLLLRISLPFETCAPDLCEVGVYSSLSVKYNSWNAIYKFRCGRDFGGEISGAKPEISGSHHETSGTPHEISGAPHETRNAKPEIRNTQHEMIQIKLRTYTWCDFVAHVDSLVAVGALHTRRTFI